MADTQGEGASIFRQSAMSRITSADDLDKYIKVTNPSAWVVLFAIVLLLGGLAIWSATAIIPTTVSVTGIAQNNKVTCWVDKDTADKMQEGGASATVADEQAMSIEVSDIPWSEVEAKEAISSDYILQSMKLATWNYEVTLTLSEEAGKDYEKARAIPVSITVSETHPLNLVLNGK